MDHYSALGVGRDASDEEIRRAYLRLARRYHPDLNTTESGGDPAAAEVRMRGINRAWEVLGSPASRAAYDRSMEGPRGVTPAGPTASTSRVRPPSRDFRPFVEDDEDDDDSWRYEPDEGDPASVPPRALLMAPPVLGLLGVALLAVSLATRLSPLAAVGIMCLVGSLLLFLGTPVVAMFLGRRSEEAARRRR